MDRGRKRGRGRLARGGGQDLDDIRTLRQVAERVKPGKSFKAKFFNALARTAGVLNVGTAITAGFARGVIEGDKDVFNSAFQAAKKSLSGEEILGFADVARDVGITPNSKLDRVALGTSGFVADVLFDPLTYLTFGLSGGLKIGARILSKGGTKAFQRASTELTEAIIEKSVRSGIKREVAERAVGRQGRRLADDLLLIATSKTGLTSASRARFASIGVSEDSLDIFTRLGSSGKMFDRGGIKFAGQEVISSKALRGSLVGRSLKRLSETAPGRAVGEVKEGLKKGFSELFVPDFGKNPFFVGILDRASIAARRVMVDIIDANKKIFKGLSEGQLDIYGKAVRKKKLGIAEAEEAAFKVRGENAISVSGKIIKLKEGQIIKEVLEVERKKLRLAAKKSQRQERLTFSDPQLQKLADTMFEGKDALIPKLAKAAGVSDKEAIKFYFPAIEDAALAGGRKQIIPGRGLQSPKLGFQKKFTGKSPETKIKDPFEAYTRRQIDVATARIQTDAIRATAKALGTFDRAVAKKNGWVKITRKVLGERTGSEKLNMWFPEEIAKDLNEFLKPGTNTIDKLSKIMGFDWATGLFKGYVTVLFPGFFVRNITSNQFQAMLKIGVDILNPMLRIDSIGLITGKNLDKVIVAKTGERLTIREIKDEILKESNIFTEGTFGKTERFVQESRDELIKASKNKTLRRINPLSREFEPVTVGRKVGQFIENETKVTIILSEVMQGKSVREAVKTAQDALFNYQKLTTFERSVMRRLIPFYTFARKNLELQINALRRTPGRVAAQFKFINNLDAAVGEPLTQEDLDGVPRFMLDNLGIKAGVDKYGRDMYLSGFGLPIEEFLERFSGDKGIIANTISSILTQMNPLFKLPLERATGDDFFRGRPIVEITKADELKPLVSFFDSLSPAVGKEVREWLDFREVETQVFVKGRKTGVKTSFVANPFRLHMFRNLFTSRIQSTIGFISDEESTQFTKMLRLFTGINGWSIDKEGQDFYNEFAEKKELQRWLKSMKIIGLKEIPYLRQ